jgi:hypothetical protein
MGRLSESADIRAGFAEAVSEKDESGIQVLLSLMEGATESRDLDMAIGVAERLKPLAGRMYLMLQVCIGRLYMKMQPALERALRHRGLLKA